MIKRIHFFALALTALFFNSCNKEDDAGKPAMREVQFTFRSADNGEGRIASATPSKVLLSIEDAAGNTVLTNEALDLVAFGGEYLTAESVMLAVGDYRLVKFIVVDEDNTAIYASPLAGSEKAALVEQPLPLSFTIAEEETTQIRPEVLAIGEDEDPADFGYLSLGFQIVDLEKLRIRVYEKTSPADSFPLTGAVLKVYQGPQPAQYELTGGVNSIPFQKTSYFNIEVFKEGYDTYLSYVVVNEYGGEIVSVTLNKRYPVAFEINMESFPDAEAGYVTVRAGDYYSTEPWTIEGTTATASAYLPSAAAQQYEVTAYFFSPEGEAGGKLALGSRVDFGFSTPTLQSGQTYALEAPHEVFIDSPMAWDVRTGRNESTFSLIASTDPLCGPSYMAVLHSHFEYIYVDWNTATFDTADALYSWAEKLWPKAGEVVELGSLPLSYCEEAQTNTGPEIQVSSFIYGFDLLGNVYPMHYWDYIPATGETLTSW